MIRRASEAVPDLIRSAGDEAVRAYRAFLDDGRWMKSTRRLYASRVKRFLRWAESRDLSLKTITAADIAAYGAETMAAMAIDTPTVYLTPVRRLFERLVVSGLRADDPCGLTMQTRERAGRWRKARTRGDVPWIVRVAGLKAMRAYREFLEYRELLGDSDVRNHQQADRLSIGRFARWAKSRRLTLQSITVQDVAAYSAEIADPRSPQAARLALAGVCGLFRHLAGSGVIASNPFENMPRRS